MSDLEIAKVKKYKSLRVYLKQQRKLVKITQKECADKAGVGIRLIRDIEQGKQTLKMSKVNQVLALFGTKLIPKPIRLIEKTK
jgi:y4mF family transcriptional regulator